jgi:hypothetical protein
MKKHNGLRHKKARKSIKKDGREKTETKYRPVVANKKGKTINSFCYSSTVTRYLIIARQ